MKSVIKEIENILSNIEGDCYIVGGYIRDKLLNTKHESNDLDIIYHGNLDAFVHILNEKGFNVICLNKSNKIYRVTINNKILDISSLKGNNIEEDLSMRDFTINSIALNLIDKRIIDPLKGREHLKAKLIHPCDDSIKKDPIRILRAYRFSIKYGLHFTKKCEEDILESKNDIMKFPKERIFSEFMKIINLDKYGIAFEQLDVLGVLEEILPYIPELKTIGKCKYHIEDVFTHMNLVYKNCKEIMEDGLKLNGLDLSIFKEKIGEFYIGDYFAFAGFCHDIGKVICYKKVGEKISFIGHDKEGFKIARDVCDKLGFPKKGKLIVQNLIEAHMYSLGLFKNNIKNYKKSFYKFFVRYDKYIPLIIAMSYCDMHATKMLYDPDDESEDMKRFLENIYKEYLIYKNVIDFKIIDGKTVKEITGVQGKEIKDVLACLYKKIYQEELNTKEEMLKWLNQYKR